MLPRWSVVRYRVPVSVFTAVEYSAASCPIASYTNVVWVPIAVTVPFASVSPVVFITRRPSPSYTYVEVPPSVN